MSDVGIPVLSEIEDLLKAQVWNLEVKAALIYFHADFWPVNTMAYTFTDYLYAQGRVGVDTSAIKFVNEQHRSESVKADLKLQILAHEKGRDDPAYIAAREEAKLALSKYARFGATL